MRLKTVYKLIAPLILIVALGSCGKAVTDPYAFTFVSKGTLTNVGAGFTGTGSIVYSAALASPTSNNSYRVTFKLDDTGSITLVSNSSNTLVGGVSVKFSRSGGTLSGSLTVGTTTNAFTIPGTVDATGSVTIQIDIHNSETPSHVLAWTSDKTTFPSASAFLNTAG